MMEDFAHKLDKSLRAAIPVGVCLLFLLLMLVPWPWAELRGLLGMVVLMALCYWVVHAPDFFSMRWSFIIGFLQDVLLGQPLGLSALLFLGADIFLRTQRLFFLQQSFRHFWIVFTLIAVALNCAVWIVRHVFLENGGSPMPFLINTLSGILLFPLISLFLHGLQRLFLAKV